MHAHTRGLDKVKGGSGQDRARKEGTSPSAPARASAHKRRVFVSLDYVLFHISVQSRSMCCFSVRIWLYVQIGRVVSS